jgi:hypothetical protein
MNGSLASCHLTSYSPTRLFLILLVVYSSSYGVVNSTSCCLFSLSPTLRSQISRVLLCAMQSPYLSLRVNIFGNPVVSIDSIYASISIMRWHWMPTNNCMICFYHQIVILSIGAYFVIHWDLSAWWWPDYFQTAHENCLICSPG